MTVELDVAQRVLLNPAAGEGETVVDQERRTLRILLSHELLDATWTRHEAGERGAEPHVHHQHTDSFYVLEGELSFRIGPHLERVIAPAGTFVAVPPNVIHAFDNDSAERACFLNFHAPSGGFADYLRGKTPGFDSFEAPADGGRPAAEVTVTLHGAGEQLERPISHHWIQAEEPHISATVMSFEPGFEGVAPHSHADFVDSFYVLEGTTEFMGTQGGPGMFVAAPPEAIHGFRIPDGGQRIVLLNVHAPDAGFIGRLRAR
jgi:quercetin dioxygenase-like cupin family protein